MILEDFYAEVLKKLGVLAAEESPSAADRLTVLEKYQAVHAEYSRREIIPWFDDEEVPDWASDPMAAIVASRLVNQFSVDAQKRMEVRVDGQMALSTIVADGQRRETEEVESTYY